MSVIVDSDSTGVSTVTKTPGILLNFARYFLWPGSLHQHQLARPQQRRNLRPLDPVCRAPSHQDL